MLINEQRLCVIIVIFTSPTTAFLVVLHVVNPSTTTLGPATFAIALLRKWWWWVSVTCLSLSCAFAVTFTFVIVLHIAIADRIQHLLLAPLEITLLLLQPVQNFILLRHH